MAEQKLGAFDALHTKIMSGGTIFQVHVTDQRLVAVKIGGQLDGGKAFTAHLGLLGALIGYFLDKRVQKKRAALRAANEGKALDELLAQDEKNFEVRYEGLSGATLNKGKLGFLGGSKAVLTMNRTGEKPLEMSLQTKEAAAAALGLLEQALRERLQVDPKLRAA